MKVFAMVRKAVTAMAVLFAWPASAETRPSDNAAVSATIAALRAGDMKELEWLVSRTGTMQFVTAKRPQKADALKALSRCKAKEKSRGIAQPFTYFEFEWKCAKQIYLGKLVLDERGQSVQLIDFLTKSEHEALLPRFPYVMGLPMPNFSITPAQKSATQIEAEKAKRKAEMTRNVELADQFAKAFANGDVTGLADRHSSYDTITYGFFNPFLDQEFVEQFWQIDEDFDDNGAAKRAILANVVFYSHAQLGKPVGWTCADADPYVECTWFYADPKTKLKSQILVFRPAARDWGIKLFWLRYETAEMLKEAEQRAALP